MFRCTVCVKTKTGLRMPGVFVVHLDWLMNSVWHCRRERETMFLLAGVSHATFFFSLLPVAPDLCSKSWQILPRMTIYDM